MLPIAKYFLYVFMLYFYVQESAVTVEDDDCTVSSQGEVDESSSAVTTIERRESLMT